MTRLDLYICPQQHRRVVHRSTAHRPDVLPCTSPECAHMAHAATAEESFDALLDAYHRFALFCDLGAVPGVVRVARDLDEILELVHVAAEHVHADCDANGFPLSAALPIGALMPTIARSAELARSLLPHLATIDDDTTHPEN